MESSSPSGIPKPLCLPRARSGAGALWEKTEPFASYRPGAISKRVSDPGPHAEFLALKELSEANDPRFDDAADLFASRHGLLGLHNFFYSPPVPPQGETLISPEAVVENGHLRFVNPAEEGLRLLAHMRDEHVPAEWRPPGRRRYAEMLKELREVVAMPDEVSVVPKALHRPHDEFTPAPGGRSVPWARLRHDYDAVLVLDPANIWSTGVSVLARRESIWTWEFILKDFPTPPDPEDSDAQGRSRALSGYLARRLTGVSPAPEVGIEGGLATGWRCNTLLESMFFMLYLDMTGGAELRLCGLSDCSQYFRPGSNKATLYFCERHHSVATSRRSRGQKP